MEELRGGADVVLKKIMRQAASERVSDVHIEPGASFVRVRFRRDGLLSDRFRLPSVMAPNLAVRVKVLGRLDVGGESSAAGWELGGGDRWGSL